MYRERIAATDESQVKARRYVGDQLGIKQATLHRWIRAADASEAAAPASAATTPSRSISPGTVRRGTGRDALAAGAIGEIADLGVGGMRLREVAHRAGISVGSVAYHFPERKDLVDAAVDTFAERLDARSAAAIEAQAAAAVLRDFYCDRETSLFWAEARIHATRDDHAGDVADHIHAALSKLVVRAVDTRLGADRARQIVATLNTAAVDTARRHRQPGPYGRAMTQTVRRTLAGSATPQLEK
ncbi:transcriptional regulator, TetR family [Williamsia serinedens]|uniref:Transcriptional regulator, TetR family n=2 Tax=Williamsia serinedens TaxID=391736 RepID=A0ABT1HB82_9NOCA|nr:transcriptional regulator, TetR family [Williamsia serinedens]